MKILRIISEVLLMLLLLVVLSCGNQKKSQLKNDATSASKIEVTISGMTCTGCEQTIKTNVTKLEGVSDVKADFKSGKAIVDFDPNLTDTSKIRSAITKSGYKVTGFNQAMPAESAIK
jgi:copper chaperone CopZ